MQTMKDRALPDTAESLATIHREIDSGTAEGYVCFTDAENGTSLVSAVLGSDPARLLPDAMQQFVPIAEQAGKKFEVTQQKDAAGYACISMQWA